MEQSKRGIGDRTHIAVLVGVLATADYLGKKPRTFHFFRGRGSEEGQVAGASTRELCHRWLIYSFKNRASSLYDCTLVDHTNGKLQVYIGEILYLHLSPCPNSGRNHHVLPHR